MCGFHPQEASVYTHGLQLGAESTHERQMRNQIHIRSPVGRREELWASPHTLQSDDPLPTSMDLQHDEQEEIGTEIAIRRRLASTGRVVAAIGSSIAIGSILRIIGSRKGIYLIGTSLGINLNPVPASDAVNEIIHFNLINAFSSSNGH